MGRCNCRDARCSCVITDSDTVTWSGSGRPDDPYQANAAGSGGGGGSGFATGDLKWTALAAAPPGWLVADGSSVSRTTYAALFAAIGTRYGLGNGTSTFNLPDFTGRFALGADNSHPLGSSGGAESFQLQTTHMPRHQHSIDHNHGGFDSATGGAHNHTAQATSQAGAHDHLLHFSAATGGSMQNIPQGTATQAGTSRAAIDDDGGHTHNVNLDPVAGHTHVVNVPNYIGDSGFAGPVSPDPVPTMPPYTTALPLIKT